MLSTFDLGHLLTYPFKDKEAQKNFLVGSLLMLAGFIIPILPTLIVYGYIAKIMKKIIAGEKASMPAWDDFNGLLMNGLRLYGVLMVYGLPIFLLLFGALGVYLAGMFVFINQESPSTGLFVAAILFLMCMMGLMLPLGIIISLLSQPAGSHAVATQKFSAGFDFGAWWPIFRKNLGGFALTVGMSYVIMFAVTIVYQIMYFTLILICLSPFFMTVGMFYMILVMEAMSAQAYREGREKLNFRAISPREV